MLQNRRNILGALAISTLGFSYLYSRSRQGQSILGIRSGSRCVRDVMTRNVQCCTRETPLLDVARKMVESHCGEIPVVDSFSNLRPIGVITDRDIVCRILAQGHNPLEFYADDCMSEPVITVHQDSSIEDCIRLMEENRVRRIPVVDRRGRVCGIVSQADLARILRGRHIGEVMRQVSEPLRGARRAVA